MRRVLGSILIVLLLAAMCLISCQEERPTPVSYVPTSQPTVEPTRLAMPIAQATLDPDASSRGLVAARDTVLEFIRQNEPFAALPARLLWIGRNTTSEELVGAASYQYTADDWVVTLQYPVVPDPDYEVSVSNIASGFTWQGIVTSNGQVQTDEAPVPGEVLSAHRKVLQYLRETAGVDLPDDATWTAASITPKGLVGSATYQFISGSWVITVQYPMVPRPTLQVRVWNQVTGYDWEGSVVQTGEVLDAVTGNVQGWEGKVIPLCRVAQFDDFFERDDGGRYGVEGVDAFVGEALVQAACGGFVVRVWGDLSTSVADAGGRQILVRRLEVIDRPTITPVQEIPDGPVDGWAGMIHPECWASQFDEYFERDDGQRFGVEADNEESREKVIEACCEELPVRIWGHMLLDEDYGGRRIVVTRIEFVH